MSPRPTTFELERLSVAPVTEAVAVLELEGRLAGAPARTRPPALVVEGLDGRRRELAALHASTEGQVVHASFTLRAADVEAGTFALAIGGLLVDLPAPDPTPGADRTVALAREVNALRRELAVARANDEAERRVAAAEERAAASERRHAELEERLADVRRTAEERDGAAAAERARLSDLLDDARSELVAARARSEEAKPAPTAPAAAPVSVDDAAPAPVEEPAPRVPDAVRPPAEPPTTVTPRAPEDTGPIPLRRRSPVSPPAPLPAPQVQSTGLLAGLEPRTVAIAALGVAGFLLVVALLGYVL